MSDYDMVLEEFQDVVNHYDWLLAEARWWARLQADAEGVVQIPPWIDWWEGMPHGRFPWESEPTDG